MFVYLFFNSCCAKPLNPPQFMGSRSTAIKDSDAFADIYGEFYDLYDKGYEPQDITLKLMINYAEILEIEEEKNDFWFAIALAQWETKSLDTKVLSTVDYIITSGADIKLWQDLGATDHDLKKRKQALDKFLEKVKSDRLKAKERKKIKLKTAIFKTGDCLTFKLKNGNYGAAIVIETNDKSQVASNLIATTRLNLKVIPTIAHIKDAEILVKNFAHFWFEETEVHWYMPDFYKKDYSNSVKLIGNLNVQFEYDNSNSNGKGYLFRASSKTSWDLSNSVDLQLEHELSQSKPTKNLFVKQLIKNGL